MTSQAQKAPLWKTILAWVGLVFGAIAILSAFSQPGVGAIAGMVLFGLAIVIPSAWWMSCQSRDHKVAAQNADLAASHDELRKYLSPADSQYADSLDSAPSAPATKRRWSVVAPASIGLLVLGATLLPTPETPAPTPAGSTGTVTSTTQASTTSTSEPTTAPATSTQPTPPLVATPAPDPEITLTTEDAPRAAYIPPPVQEPAPAPQEPATEAPIPAAPAPVAGVVSFSNCAEARDAGAAPMYVGSPGYRTGLDRDGDGIACDK